jgi:hypothetical protein
MRKIAIFLHFSQVFHGPGYLYHRQEGQVHIANLWDFSTVGSLRPQW